MSNNAENKSKKREEAKALFAKYAANPSEKLRNEIVERYLYLAEILSKKYAGRGIEYDDLYQVASVALVLAVDRFDPYKGFAFASFASPTIIGEIKRYFRDKSWAVRVPRRVKELSIQLAGAQDSLYARNGRPPTVNDLAKYLGASEEEILEAMETGNTYRAYSLNSETESEGDESAVSMNRFMSVEESGYETFENADLINHVIAGLTDKERAIFDQRVFGSKTQQEVAREYGVSQVTISRLEAEIREKFKKEYHKTV